MAALSPLEKVLRRDRLILIIALAMVIVACWAYVLDCPGIMATVQRNAIPRAPVEPDDDMPGMTMGEGAAESMSNLAAAAMAPVAWTPDYATLMFLTWWIMMMAMILPSATPMILLLAVINRKQRDKGAPYLPTGIFAAGYLLVWGAFSLVAVSTQWGLERSGLLSSTMASTSVLLGATLLIAAGVYQLTPAQARLPAPLPVGHGAFCTGCCWFLMALLFYGGIMNLYWIIGLALYVLLEKTMPAGHSIAQIAGALLIGWGSTLMLVVVP
jgi:predicted metal-binding membrane protein